MLVAVCMFYSEAQPLHDQGTVPGSMLQLTEPKASPGDSALGCDSPPGAMRNAIWPAALTKINSAIIQPI
jgi:hypothetical protein